jgi:hypothetical protein
MARITNSVENDPYRKWGVSWTVGFRSSSCRKAAQKLKQRRVDLGWPLLLKPVAGILHQPDVAQVGALLAHQFDHVDAPLVSIFCRSGLMRLFLLDELRS